MSKRDFPPQTVKHTAIGLEVGRTLVSPLTSVKQRWEGFKPLFLKEEMILAKESQAGLTGISFAMQQQGPI